MADTPRESPAEAAKREAQSIGDEAREMGREAYESAKTTARGYADRARDEAYAQSEAYREYAAQETGKVASALRRASDDLRDGSPQERLVGQVADGIAEAADRMRGMTFEDIARDTSDFARRHPAAFLGGAALVGFAAARFMKASAQGGDDDYTAPPPAPRPSPYSSASAPAPSRAPAASPTPSPTDQTKP